MRDTGIESTTSGDATASTDFSRSAISVPLALTWSLADLARRTRHGPSSTAGDPFDAAGAELRRLIREGFEAGISGEKTRRGGRSVGARGCTKSGTADGEPSHRLFIAYDREPAIINEH